MMQTYCDIDMLVYASVWLPWPFAERDVLISAVADDQLRDKGVVAISFASPREMPVSEEIMVPQFSHVIEHISVVDC
jgi:hypothetical protein